MKKIGNILPILGLLCFLSNNLNAQNFFSQNTTSGLPSNAWVVDVADYDNDNDLDVLAGLATGNVHIYANDGSGSFSQLTGTVFDNIAFGLSDIKFVDIDGDNDQDVLILAVEITGAYTGSKLYRNDGGSTFTEMNTFPAINSMQGTIAAGDLDNDTDNDLIIVGQGYNGNTDVYSSFINDGSGNFTYTVQANNNGIFYNTGQIPVIANFNNDNLNDILLMKNGNDNFTSYLNSGGSYTGTTLTAFDNNIGGVADIDGDGDTDIIINDQYVHDAKTKIYLNNGSGAFTVSSQSLAGATRGVLATGDVDNDGDVDIYRRGLNYSVSGYEGGMYINKGDGTFYHNTDVSLSDLSDGDAEFADFNGDGYPELLMSNNGVTYYYDNNYKTHYPDKALDLDGVNIYTASHKAALNTLPMTIEFWLYETNRNQIVGIMDKWSSNNGFQIAHVNSYINCTYGTDASNLVSINSNSFSLTNNTWHHIAIVIESTGMKLYGDGVLRQSATWTGSAGAISNTADWRIGRWTSSSGFFSGLLDEVRIWNTARTQAEIANNMCTAISNSQSNANLVAYYSMNNYYNNPEVIFDGSSNANLLSIASGSRTFGTQQTNCTPAAALPVELLYFNGHVENGKATLNWSTATEENNEGFEIEKSTNGIDWQMIDFVEGNGITTEISNYEFIDNTPVKGNNYYRLKQIDYDGNYEYSNIIQLETGNSQRATVHIFPNPANETITIENIEIGTPIQIYDVTGRILMEQNAQSTVISPSIHHLANGIYYIQVGQQTQKLVIQH